MSTIRTLLADDHHLFRQGLRRILASQPDIEVVAEAGSGLEAIDLAKEHKPDVAIVDIAMKELNGIETTAHILKHSPLTAVLILSMYSDERYVFRAVRAGAKGYVLKDTLEEGLIEAIYSLHRGQPFFSPVVAKLLHEAHARDLERRKVDDRYDLLTERERQIYHLLAEGRSNKEIAARVGLSLHTVETHRTRIMEKLGIHSIAELVLGAVRRGIVV
ncbi:MAG TPA: response regulator transcription factor [Bryobacteraceae bacterium]|jgi:DNA-binding NarL/FixJ family response regulator|nr:response regulator transcription factor [Bryobacteraceae bacterium]